MTLVTRPAASYEPPSADVHNAVICEFVDMGLSPNPFKMDKTTGRPEMVHQGKYILQVEETNQRNARKELHVFFAMKLGNKKFPTKFDKIANAALGRPFSKEEVKNGVDAKMLVGKTIRVTVKHSENADGDTRAKVTDFMPSKGVTMTPENYTPLANRGERVPEEVPF